MWGAQGWNQWSVQPPAFDDVPHEQIDWAALAKQWIQMQQSKPSETHTAASPLSLPQGQISPAPISKEDSSSSIPVYKTPVSSHEPFETERLAEDNSGNWKWASCAASDIDERTWPPPTNVQSSLIPSKETYDYGHIHDNNTPLAMQSIDYNHGGSHGSTTRNDFSYEVYNSSEKEYDYWMQVSHSASTSLFLKKEPATSHHHEEESTASQIDAAKRKQLPAWIREGLEKRMEEERLKKLEKEKAAKERFKKEERDCHEKNDLPPKENPSFLPEKSKFESDSEPDSHTEVSADLKINRLKKKSPVSRLAYKTRTPSNTPFTDLRSAEERKKEMLFSIRRVLTEILLTVTNAEIEGVAKEIFFKEREDRARQLASTVEDTSVAPGLRGLVNYGTDESEASGEEEEAEIVNSDEDLNYKIKERGKRHMSAVKERKNMADFERKELDGKWEAVKNLNDIKSPRNYSSNSSEMKYEKEKAPKITDDEKKINVFSFTPPPQLSDLSEKSIRIPLINDLDEDIPINHGDKEENPNFEERETSPQVSREHTLKKDSPCDADSSSSSSKSSESESSNRGHEILEHEKERDDKKTDLKSRRTRERETQKNRHSSSDSERSYTHKREKSRDEKAKSDKKADYKRKKRDRRSYSRDSTSSSGSTRRRHRSRSHSRRDYRSGSYEERARSKRHRRSVSPRSYRNRNSKASYSYRHDRDRERSRHDRRYHDYKRSPSPYKRSYKSPKKYRSSRSPSSDNDSYGRKMKNSRYH